MYKHVLRSIEGIGIYPSVGLILFLGFFIGLLIWVMRKDRSHWQELARMPLEQDEPTQNSTKDLQ